MLGQARDVGILFADISGSMRLYELFGNRGALAAIETYLGHLGEVVRRHGGEVVKTIGDEIMASFPSVSATWSAAIESQTVIDRLPAFPSGEGPLKVGLRVGFSFGPAIANNGDYFGGTVNMAARMVQIAKRGQILTTNENTALLPAGHRYMSRGLDWVAVKGKPDGVQVVEVLWNEGTLGRTTISGLQPAGISQPAVTTELVLTLGERQWCFDGRCSSIAIGREEANDVVVTISAASRNHATIERRRDRWILIDHSSNGTFVSPSGEPDIHLRREEYLLGPRGLIGFGHPVAGSAPGCMAYAVTRSVR